jgi:hypothetical protein
MCSSAAVRRSGAIGSAKAPADTPMARLISGGDYGGTERGCRSLESGQAVRDRS